MAKVKPIEKEIFGEEFTLPDNNRDLFDFIVLLELEKRKPILAWAVALRHGWTDGETKTLDQVRRRLPKRDGRNNIVAKQTKYIEASRLCLKQAYGRLQHPSMSKKLKKLGVFYDSN